MFKIGLYVQHDLPVTRPYFGKK